MGTSDAFMVSVPKANPGTGNTGQTAPTDQTNNSAFLTVQSFTNFTAMAGAITAAWKATQLVWDGASSAWYPFALCVGWWVATIITSQQAGAASEKGRTFLANSIFLGGLNMLTLFAAVMGVNGAGQ